MITNPDAALVKLARESSLPTVVLDTDLHQRGLDSVVVDNTAGTREGVEHLLTSVPARDLYFVGGPRDNFDTMQRARGRLPMRLAAAGGGRRPDQVSVRGLHAPSGGASGCGGAPEHERGRGAAWGDGRACGQRRDCHRDHAGSGWGGRADPGAAAGCRV